MNWKGVGMVVAGAAIGAVANTLWSMWPEAGRFKATALRLTSPTGEPEKSPLAFIEHYHWGLACIAIAPHTKPARDLLIGLGASLMAVEATGEQPFGVGKTEAEVKGNVMLAGILTGVNLISWSIAK